MPKVWLRVTNVVVYDQCVEVTKAELAKLKSFEGKEVNEDEDQEGFNLITSKLDFDNIADAEPRYDDITVTPYVKEVSNG